MNEYEKHPILNKIINNVNSNFNIAQAYLLVGSDIEILKEKALSLSKAFVCPNTYEESCKKCNICSRIDEDNYGEFKIINPINRTIKKEVVIDVKNSFQTNSVEGKFQVYVINGVECLNQSAANSILKFLEEPDSNTIAIFTTTNIDMVISTIVSRCQVIRIGEENRNKDKDYILKITGLNEENYNYALSSFIEIEKKHKNSIIYLKSEILCNFSTKEDLHALMKLFLLIYRDMLNYKIFGIFENFAKDDEFINFSINQTDKQIIRKISFILENINKLEYNVNIMLFMSNLLIGIGEISDGKCSRN